MPERVTVGFAVEGVEAAKREVESFGDSLDAIYSRMNAVTMSGPMGGTAKPAGAPSIVPPTSNGLGQYNAPINTSQSQLDMGLSAMHGVLGNPYTSFIPKPSPGIIPKAPDPYGSTPPPMLPSSGGGSGPGGGGGNGPIDVRVVWSVPLHFAGGAGGIMGGNGPGGGGWGGPNGSGGVFGGGMGGVSLPHPSPGMDIFQPGGSAMDRFLAGVKQNPTLWGAAESALKAIPVGPAALLAGAAATASYGLNAYRAATDPRFHTDLDIASQQASGLFVNPLMAGAMRRSADIQGTDAMYRSLLNPFDKVLFGLPSDIYGLTAGRDFAQQAALARAGGQDDLIRQRVTALTGGPLAMNSTTRGLQGRIDADEKEFAALRQSNVMAGGGGKGTPGDLYTNPEYFRLAKELSDLKAQAAGSKAAVGSTMFDRDALTGMGAVMPFGAAAGGAFFQNRDALYGGFGPRYTPDLVNQGYGAAASLAMQPGMGGLYDLIRKNPGSVDRALVGLSPQLGQLAASQGDFGGVAALQPLLSRATGSDKLFDSLLQVTEMMRTLGASLQVNQSGLGGVQAGIQTLRYTGAGYGQIAAAQGGVLPLYQSNKALYQRKLAQAIKSGDVVAIADARAHIAATDSEIASVPYTQAMTVFEGRAVDNQTLSLGASNDLFRSMYSGTQAGVDAAFRAQGRASMAEAARLDDMAASPFVSPEQRSLYKQQARQARQQGQIGADRSRSEYDFGITQGQIGVAGARAAGALTQARLYSDPSGIYAADMGVAGVTQMQLGAVRARLGDPSAHLSEGERLDLQARSVSLLTDFNAALENSRRSFLSLDVSVTQTGQSIIAQQGNRSFLLGAGGGSAYALGAANVLASDNSIAKQRRVLANLPPGSPQYATEQDKLEGMLTGREQARLGIADTPLPIGLRMQEMNAQGQFNIMQKTYLPFGDTRLYYATMMDAKGRELREFASLRAQAKKGGYDDQAFEERLRGRELGTVSGMADLQNQLSEGWEGRLISSVVGLPSRGAFATAAFTRSEASKFLQNLTPGFGFSGAGGAAARDDWMFRGPHLYGTTIGALQRPEGFMATAMSGTNIATMSGVLKAPAQLDGRIEVHVVVHDTGGKVMGKGSATTTIHDLQNGALQISLPTHNLSGGSHQ